MDNNFCFEDREEENEYWNSVYKETIKLQEDAINSSASWIRHLLLLASTLLGLLVSLSPGGNLEPGTPLHTRYCFAVAILLLTLCILSGCITLFREVYYKRAYLSDFCKATKKAVESHRSLEIVPLTVPHFFRQTERITYSSFALAFLSLFVYMIMLLFAS